MVSDFINFSKNLNYLPCDTNNYNVSALNKQQKVSSSIDLKFCGSTAISSGKTYQDGSKYINVKENLDFIINKLQKVYNNLNPVISKVNNNILEVVVQDLDFIKYDKLSTCSLTNEQYRDILEASTVLQDLNNNFIKDAKVVAKFESRRSNFYQKNFIVNLVYETTYKNFKPPSNSFIKRDTLDVLVELYNSLQSSISTLNEIIKNQQIILKIPIGFPETQYLLQKSKENLRGVKRFKSDLLLNINKLKENRKLAVLIEESETCSNSNESINAKFCKSEIIGKADLISTESYISAFKCILEEVENKASLNNSLEIMGPSSISLTFGDENPSFSTQSGTNTYYEELVPFTEISVTSSYAPITIIDSSCCLKSSIPFLKKSIIKSKSFGNFKESDYSLLDNKSLNSFLSLSLDKISLKYSNRIVNKNLEHLKKFGNTCIVVGVKSQCFQSVTHKQDKIVLNKNVSSSSKSSYHSLRYTEGNTILTENVPNQQDILPSNFVSRKTTAVFKTDKFSKNILKEFESHSTITLHPKEENITSLNRIEKQEKKIIHFSERNNTLSNEHENKKSNRCVSKKSAIFLSKTLNCKVIKDTRISKSMVTIPAICENLTLLSKRYHKETNKSKFSIKYVKTCSDTSLAKSKPKALQNKKKNIYLVKQMDIPYEASTTSIPKEDDLPKCISKSRKHKVRKTNLKVKQTVNKHLPYDVSNTSLPIENDYCNTNMKIKTLSTFNYYTNLGNLFTFCGNAPYNIYYNSLIKNESFKDKVETSYSNELANTKTNELNSDSGINSESNNTESLTKDLPWGLQIFEVRVVGMERQSTGEGSSRRNTSESYNRRLTEVSTTGTKSKYYDYPEIPAPERSSIRNPSSSRRDTDPADFQSLYYLPRQSIPLNDRPWAPFKTSDISLPLADYGKSKKSSRTKKAPFTDAEVQVSSLIPNTSDISTNRSNISTKNAGSSTDIPYIGPFKLVPVSMIRSDSVPRYSLDHEIDPKMLPYVLTDLNQVQGANAPQQPLNLVNISNENPNLTRVKQLEASTQTEESGSLQPLSSKKCELPCGTQTYKKMIYCRAASTSTDNNLTMQQTPQCCCNQKNKQGNKSTSGATGTVVCCGNCPNKNLPKSTTQNQQKNCNAYHNPNVYYSFVDVKKPKSFHNRNKKIFKNNYLNELLQVCSEKLLKNKMKSETQSQSLSKIYNCKFLAIDEKANSIEGNHCDKHKTTNTKKLIGILNKKPNSLEKNVCKNKFTINSDSILESIKKIKSETNDKRLRTSNERLCISDTNACTPPEENERKNVNRYLNYKHEQEKLSKHSLLKKMMDYDNKYEIKKETIKINLKEELKLKRCPSCCNLFNKNVTAERMDRHHNRTNRQIRVDTLNNLQIVKSLGQSDWQKNSYHAASGEFSRKFLKCLSNCHILQPKSKIFNFKDLQREYSTISGLLIKPTLQNFILPNTVCNYPLYSSRFENSNNNLVKTQSKCLNEINECKFVNHFSNSDSQLYVRVNKNYVYDNMASICSNMQSHENDELQKIYTKIKRCCNSNDNTLKQLTTRSGTNFLIDKKLDRLENEQAKSNGDLLTDLIALKTLAQSLLISPNILINSFEESFLDNLIVLIADNIRKYSDELHNYSSKLSHKISEVCEPITDSLSDNKKN